MTKDSVGLMLKYYSIGYEVKSVIFDWICFFLIADSQQHEEELILLDHLLQQEIEEAASNTQQTQTPFDCFHDPDLKFEDLILREHLPAHVHQKKINTTTSSHDMAIQIVKKCDPNNTATLSTPFLISQSQNKSKITSITLLILP